MRVTIPLRFGSTGVKDKQTQSEPPSSTHPDPTRSWVARMAARGEVSPTDAGVTATDIRNYRSLTIAVQDHNPVTGASGRRQGWPCDGEASTTLSGVLSSCDSDAVRLASR